MGNTFSPPKIAVPLGPLQHHLPSISYMKICDDRIKNSELIQSSKVGEQARYPKPIGSDRSTRFQIYFSEIRSRTLDICALKKPCLVVVAHTGRSGVNHQLKAFCIAAVADFLFDPFSELLNLESSKISRLQRHLYLLTWSNWYIRMYPGNNSSITSCKCYRTIRTPSITTLPKRSGKLSSPLKPTKPSGVQTAIKHILSCIVRNSPFASSLIDSYILNRLLLLHDLIISLCRCR